MSKPDEPIKDEKNLKQPEKEETAGVSRRKFITGTGGLSALVAAATTGMASPSAEGETTGQSTANRVTDEPPMPAVVPAPKVTDYQCDVLIIGGGFAGINAAVAARKSGKSVVLVDKGRPGFSGLSSFASSHRWFDPAFGDDANAFRHSVQMGSEYIANLDWYQVWIDESRAAYQRLKDWGILTQYPKAAEAGYAESHNYVGYRERFGEQDRRPKFVKVLEDNGIGYVVQTMIIDLVQEDGKLAGAIGFDVPSGAILTFRAKAIVLCMGGGSYKPTGFPTGSNSFDGEYIGYNLGLPIIGKEFDDFHMTVSFSAGNAFLSNSWEYLENIWLCGGDITAKNAEQSAITKGKILVQQRVLKCMNGLPLNDGTVVEDVSKADATRRGGSLSGNPADPRIGKHSSPTPKEDVYGSAVGMCLHLTSGIFCGLDDLVGYTGMPGLYVAGDGINGSAVTGSAYPHGVGFTSNFCSIQGWRAGQAAAQYAGTVDFTPISSGHVADLTKGILAPTTLKVGHDPNWARDVLHATMAPYWIHITKSDAALRGALAQVEVMRDDVVPKLVAASSHDLRLCHEMRHKVLSAEMKLRAGMERKESRGLHYRTDYPFRDDKNFLCYIALRKGQDGAMSASRIEVKDAWKGDLTQDYSKRYAWRFPGEAKAMGLPEEEPSAADKQPWTTKG